jgi:uncharacterized SAM-binding protein YcdF (DUF218 family)
MPMTQIIHALLLPPALLCWLGLLALVLAWRGWRISAALLALLAIVLNYALATPAGAYFVAHPLEQRVSALHDLGQIPSAGYQAIVVLGGGRYEAAPEFSGHDTMNAEMLMRLRYAARVERATQLPILVTGGSPLGSHDDEASLMAETLTGDFRVPVRWQERLSRTTEENAELSWAMLSPLGIKHIVLVSHASHLPRAQALFERAGFQVLAAPTGFTTKGAQCRAIICYTPQHSSLLETRRALHEWLGLARDAIESAVPR